MDDTQFAALLKVFGADLTTNIVEGISKAMQPKKEDEPVKKTVVKFEGDPDSAEDLAKHEDLLYLSGCDLTSLTGLKKWQAYQTEKAKNAQPEDVAELRLQIEALKERITQSEGASNGPVDSTNVAKGATIAEKLAAGKARAQKLSKEGVL